MQKEECRRESSKSGSFYRIDGRPHAWVLRFAQDDQVILLPIR